MAESLTFDRFYRGSMLRSNTTAKRSSLASSLMSCKEPILEPADNKQLSVQAILFGLKLKALLRFMSAWSNERAEKAERPAARTSQIPKTGSKIWRRSQQMFNKEQNISIQNGLKVILLIVCTVTAEGESRRRTGTGLSKLECQ